MSESVEEPGADRAVRESYFVSGVTREDTFAALLDVRRFPEWAIGLRRVRLLDSATGVGPGVALAFSLTAVGLRHDVISTVTVVEPPRLLEWRYTSGAAGGGGWLLEEVGAEIVRVTFSTDYELEPAWLDRLAHRPFFRGVTDDLLRRSLRNFVRFLKEKS